MNIFFYTCLFIFGIMFGSFSSVVIYRLKSNEGGILTGRSHCSNCNNILKSIDLIPIFSWLKNKGKCRYCKSKVSSIYPALEITMGFLFTFIGYFLIDFNLILDGSYIEISKLIFWLIIGFISVVYTFYDILFLEISDFIMLIGIVLIIITLGIQTLFPSINIINTFGYSETALSTSIGAIIVSVIIIGLLYTIMLKELHEFVDVLIIIMATVFIVSFKYLFNVDLGSIAILNGAIGALSIFIFFFLQIIISKGAWLGGGDLRIAIFIGLILGLSFSFTGVMITYLVGSVIGISLIISSKIKNGFKTKFDTMIPFGPFLAIGFFINIFLQSEISKLIEIYF